MWNPPVPSATQILAGLDAISHDAVPLAVLWHAIALLMMVAILAGWKPSRRRTAQLLTLPILSVAILAWTYRNPFNGAAFSALAIALSVIAVRLPVKAVPRPPPWSVGLGLAMAGFGLIYPHFLHSHEWLSCLYAAPTGLLPCPTLALVIGVSLATDGLGSRVWSLVLAGAGLFYGIFGVARLGVVLDLGLFIGAAALGGRAVRSG